MSSIKQNVRKLVPKSVLRLYHRLFALLGALRYRHPSRRLIVIGVTGTKGKSTVVNLIARILEEGGHTIGLISTINFKIGKREWINETKQTMPGRFRLQKLLADMVRAGCRYAIIETSSEGIAQYRHLGVEYDVAVLTNITPEHIESHGTYAKYRSAKLELFEMLSRTYRKKILGNDIKKIIVVNTDDRESKMFLAPSADDKWAYGLKEKASDVTHGIYATAITEKQNGVSFNILDRIVNLKLLGEFNVYNALASYAVGLSQDINTDVIISALQRVDKMPGRLEEIPNDKGIRIFVDYAHEPSSLQSVYDTIRGLSPRKIIGVLGSQGGGRDRAKRPVLGRIAGLYADYVIITNEDPYDESPQKIIDDVAEGTLENGKVLDETCWKILDRTAAIQKALSLAESGDVVIITGKGSETVMAVKGSKKIPWDDRVVVREILDASK